MTQAPGWVVESRPSDTRLVALLLTLPTIDYISCVGNDTILLTDN